MAAILKIISLILWAIDYAKKNPKKTTAATLGSGVVAMGLYGGSGVPTNPPSPFNYGNVGNLPGSDGDVLTSDGDGTYTMEAGGGGSGLTVTGTPTYGDTVGWNENGGASGQWEPRNPGVGVIDVTAYGASGRGDISTTGTVTSGSPTLTLASASTFAKGQGLAIAQAGASHGLSAPSNATIGVGGTAGATSYTLGVSTGSRDAGYTAVATVATTTGNATISPTNYLWLCWDTVANAGFYLITGDSATQANRSVIARKNSATNAYKITFQAGGYVSAVQGDIGRTVTRGTSTGVLAGYDNTNRFWWIIPTLYGTDTFASFGDVVISGGTGDGTTTAVVAAHAWKWTGHTATIATTEQPSLARRVSSVYYPGDIIMHPVHPTNGEYWICDRVAMRTGQYPTSNATATASLTLGSAPNAVGTIAQDGDIYWRRINLPIPVDEPTAAVPDMLLTTISAISGTTVTMAANAGNSITSQLVMHNDATAVIAAHAALFTSSGTADTLYFRPGRYNFIVGNSESDTFSQWDDTYVATNFILNYGQADRVPRSWKLADAAQFQFMSMGSRAAHSDAGDKDFIFMGIDSSGFTIDGGQFTNALIAEPKSIAADAWNRMNVLGSKTTDSAVSQRVSNTVFKNSRYFGFPRLSDSGTLNGYSAGDKFLNLVTMHGGAGHDSLTYGTIAEFCGNVCFGHPYDSADWLYTGEVTIADQYRICDNKFYYGRATDNVRLRAPGGIVERNTFTDCTGRVIYCESEYTGSISHNIFKNGGTVSITGTDVAVDGNIFNNAQLVIVGGQVSVNGGAITWDTNAGSYFQSGNACLNISGGSVVSITGLIVKNTESANQGEHGISIESAFTTGRINLSNVTSYSESGYGLFTSSSALNGGFLTWNGGRIRGGAGPQAMLIDAHANSTMVFDGVTFDASSAANTLYSDQGALYFSNCDINHALGGGASVLSLKNCRLPAANASSVGVYTSGTVDGNVFGVAPTVTTPALLLASDNQIGTQSTSSPAALAAGSTNNYPLSVVDNQRLDPDSGGSTLTGIVAWEDGTEKTITNIDAGAATIILDEGATASTDANEFTFVGGDLTIPAGQSATIKYDGTSDKWRLKSKTF